MQMKEAVAVSGMSAYTIRFYEKKGLLRVARDTNGVRDFSEAALNRLKWIQCYRKAGLSLKEIASIISGNITQESYLAMLTNAKQRLDDEIETLQRTEAFLATKRRVTIAGESLADITTCAPHI